MPIYHKLIYLIRHAVNLEAGLMTVKYPVYLILNFTLFYKITAGFKLILYLITLFLAKKHLLYIINIISSNSITICKSMKLIIRASQQLV